MRIILAIFSDRFEAFSSLRPFYDTYPEYEKFSYNIDTYLSRKKEPYKHQDFTLMRLDVRKSLRP
jgi:hypothetical protein